MESEEAERLYQSSVGLIDAVACTRYRKMRDDPDLLRSGRLGLWSAALHWPGGPEQDFRSYAYASIKNEMEAYRKTIEKWEPPAENRETDGAVDDGPMHDAMSAVRARYGPNSRERLILTALSKGVAKAAIAAYLGVSVWKINDLARRAYNGIVEDIV
ncbi:MAG: hypothetical protein LKK00_09355 [Intestinimonas sp.]|jgi:hypothetical protein|nr:hypothetical protein [Intestinimonas sp.]